jgi:tRNA(fMet)-specific endonuclease VapC
VTRYSLDTNICIGFLNGDPSIGAALQTLEPEDAIVCRIVRAELYFRARSSARVERNIKSLSSFPAALQSADFDEESAIA